MKRILHIVALGSILALSACEIPFDIKQEGVSKIYVQAIANQNMIMVQPVHAAALGETFQKDMPFEATMTVNGESVPLEGENPYYCFMALEEGDEIDVTVKADGLQTVQGHTTVVPTPEITDMTWEEVQVDTIEATRVTLTLDHAPLEDEYYAVQIMGNMTTVYSDGSSTNFSFFDIPGYILSVVETGKIDLEDFLQLDYVGGGTLRNGSNHPFTLLTTKHFKGNQYTFYLNSLDRRFLDQLRDNMPDEDTGIAGGGIVSGEVGGSQSGGEGSSGKPGAIPIGLKTSYYFFIYRLSPEFYQYAKALYQSNFDFLSNMGLTPANFTYTNVTGGMGFVGSAIPAVSPELVMVKRLF